MKEKIRNGLAMPNLEYLFTGDYTPSLVSNKGTYAEWYWNALNEDPNTAKKSRRERHFAITKFHNENYGMN